jgi:hypothetical protein
MDAITIKKTRTNKKDKKGRTIVIVEKQYKLPPEILCEIMSYFAPAIENHLIKMGIEKLHDMYKTCLHTHYTNINKPSIGLNLEERKMILIKPLMNFHFKNDLTKKYPDIGAKRVLKKTTINTTEFRVGDMVVYRGHNWDEDEGGVIIKITDSRYHIQLYEKTKISFYVSHEPIIYNGVPKTIFTWEDKIKNRIVRVVGGFHKVDNYLIEKILDM